MRRKPVAFSPEQAAGKTDVDARSDIYSIGAVAYFLVTGKVPLARSMSVETMAARVAETVVAPSLLCPETPSDVEAVILRCLAKAPQSRFQDVASVEQALALCACRNAWPAERDADWWQTVPLVVGHQQVVPLRE